ncbi:MAG: hypothetical protein WCK31_05295 [bacterium]
MIIGTHKASQTSKLGGRGLSPDQETLNSPSKKSNLGTTLLHNIGLVLKEGKLKIENKFRAGGTVLTAVAGIALLAINSGSLKSSEATVANKVDPVEPNKILQVFPTDKPEQIATVSVVLPTIEATKTPEPTVTIEATKVAAQTETLMPTATPEIKQDKLGEKMNYDVTKGNIIKIDNASEKTIIQITIEKSLDFTVTNVLKDPISNTISLLVNFAGENTITYFKVPTETYVINATFDNWAGYKVLKTTEPSRIVLGNIQGQEKSKEQAILERNLSLYEMLFKITQNVAVISKIEKTYFNKSKSGFLDVSASIAETNKMFSKGDNLTNIERGINNNIFVYLEENREDAKTIFKNFEKAISKKGSNLEITSVLTAPKLNGTNPVSLQSIDNYNGYFQSFEYLDKETGQKTLVVFGPHYSPQSTQAFNELNAQFPRVITIGLWVDLTFDGNKNPLAGAIALSK